MNAWWEQLETINRVFYGAAAFFSVFFIWQIIAIFAGLDTDGDAGADGAADGDLGGDHTYDNFEHGAEVDAAETMTAFKLLSFRSILTFFTLFSWGAALHLDGANQNLSGAIVYGTVWGLAGMLAVALIFYAMRKMTESGNKKLSSCVGKDGTVYLDIPAGGAGEIRITVSGSVSYVKARAKDGDALKASTPVRVIKQLGQNTVEVEKL